eukprot:10201297-Alexandrium_andersonii.AAC.1
MCIRDRGSFELPEAAYICLNLLETVLTLSCKIVAVARSDALALGSYCTGQGTSRAPSRESSTNGIGIEGRSKSLKRSKIGSGSRPKVERSVSIRRIGRSNSASA